MDNTKEKFSLIYDQYIEKIYRFVYLKVNSQPIAEDLTSKVFLKVWEAYSKGQDIKNWGAFLYQTARNTVVDYYREKGNKKVVSIDYAGQLAETNNNPHEQAVLGADIEAIKSVIFTLKPEYQDVLIWYYLEDMSAEQIAQMLDKSAGSVRVLIHRALEALKAKMP